MNLRNRVIALLCLLVLALLMAGVAMRSCTSTGEPSGMDGHEVLTQPEAIPAPGTPRAPYATAGNISAPPPGTGATALVVQFKEGRLVEVSRSSVANASVRPSRRLEGQTGLYYRIVSATGQVSFESLVSDPRIVHWDTSDDGKTLRGGVVMIEDVPLQLRLPMGVSGRLEVYLMTNPSWSRSSLDKHGRHIGGFDL